MEQGPAVIRSQRKGRNLELVAERTEETPQPNDAAREAALAAKEASLQAALATVKTALDILSVRARSMLALAASICLFAWAVYEPSVLRLVGAAIFAGMVLLPVLWQDKG